MIVSLLSRSPVAVVQLWIVRRLRASGLWTSDITAEKIFTLETALSMEGVRRLLFLLLTATNGRIMRTWRAERGGEQSMVLDFFFSKTLEHVFFYPKLMKTLLLFLVHRTSPNHSMEPPPVGRFRFGFDIR